MKAIAKNPSTKEVKLLVAGESRAFLLPPEVAGAVRDRSNKRALVGVVAIAAITMVGAWGFAFVANGASAVSLAAEQQKSTELIGQQTEFAEVRTVQADLAAIEAARAIGTATEIDWGTYYADLASRLPEGVTFTGLSIETATPLEQIAQAAVPFQGPRVVTMTLDLSSPQIIDVTGLLANLAGLPGFVDASPKTLSRAAEDEKYDVTVILHLDAGAYWNRFTTSDADVEISEGVEE